MSFKPPFSKPRIRYRGEVTDCADLMGAAYGLLFQVRQFCEKSGAPVFAMSQKVNGGVVHAAVIGTEDVITVTPDVRVSEDESRRKIRNILADFYTVPTSEPYLGGFTPTNDPPRAGPSARWKNYLYTTPPAGLSDFREVLDHIGAVTWSNPTIQLNGYPIVVSWRGPQHKYGMFGGLHHSSIDMSVTAAIEMQYIWRATSSPGVMFTHGDTSVLTDSGPGVVPVSMWNSPYATWGPNWEPLYIAAQGRRDGYIWINGVSVFFKRVATSGSDPYSVFSGDIFSAALQVRDGVLYVRFYSGLKVYEGMIAELGTLLASSDANRFVVIEEIATIALGSGNSLIQIPYFNASATKLAYVVATHYLVVDTYYSGMGVGSGFGENSLAEFDIASQTQTVTRAITAAADYEGDELVYVYRENDGADYLEQFGPLYHSKRGLIADDTDAHCGVLGDLSKGTYFVFYAPEHGSSGMRYALYVNHVEAGRWALDLPYNGVGNKAFARNSNANLPTATPPLLYYERYYWRACLWNPYYCGLAQSVEDAGWLDWSNITNFPGIALAMARRPLFCNISVSPLKEFAYVGFWHKFTNNDGTQDAELRLEKLYDCRGGTPVEMTLPVYAEGANPTLFAPIFVGPNPLEATSFEVQK